jgi:purine-binding chemotaxis protein CheW
MNFDSASLDGDPQIEDGVTVAVAVAQPRLEVLIFELGGQRYGLPSAVVRELVRAVTIVSLPKAPAIVEGVIDVRGSVIPVLDIRERFGLPPKPLEHTDHFVVARAGASRLVAIRADRALDLVRLDAAQIEDVTASVRGVEHVAGVAKLPDGLVIIHDLETFLSSAEAAALAAAMTAAAQGREG